MASSATVGDYECAVFLKTNGTGKFRCPVITAADYSCVLSKSQDP